MTYLGPHLLQVALLGILILSGVGLQIYNPMILKSFIDAATTKTEIASLGKLSVLYLFVILGTQVISVLTSVVGQDLAWKTTNALRLDLSRHCLYQDMAFFKSHTSGEIIERIDGDINVVSGFFSTLLLNMLSNVLLIVSVLVVLFRIDWRVGVGLTIFAGAALLIYVRLRAWGRQQWAGVRECYAHFFGFLGEQLGGMVDIRSSGATSFVMRGFHEHLQTWFPIQRKAALATIALWMAGTTISGSGLVLALSLGAFLWQQHLVTVGTVYLIVHYVGLIQGPIQGLRGQMQEVQQATASLDRIANLFSTAPTIREQPGTALPEGTLSVQFDNVTFGYDPDTVVLPELSFHLAPGTVTGLIGRTGSGKSTIARLIVRLYDPTSGTIRLGDISTEQIQLSSLRKRVSLVTQDVQLFAASIRDNVTLFDPTIADESILSILEQVGLTSWYQSMPEGLDTLLEGEGGGMSAGEAQLLALVRVFLADPGVVILDEASSRLDPATDLLIEKAIQKLVQGRTTLIIAHKLKTLDRTDNIILLEAGRIVESGSRIALLAQSDSQFYRLSRTGMEEVLA